MSNSGQNTLIIILSGVLLAALAAAVVVVFILPSGTLPFGDDFISKLNVFSSNTSTPANNSEPGMSDFDLKTFERKSYTDLNTTLINNGLLPVRPDPAAGKANPFL